MTEDLIKEEARKCLKEYSKKEQSFEKILFFSVVVLLCAISIVMSVWGLGNTKDAINQIETIKKEVSRIDEFGTKIGNRNLEFNDMLMKRLAKLEECDATVSKWRRIAMDLKLTTGDVKEKFMTDYEKCLSFEGVK